VSVAPRIIQLHMCIYPDQQSILISTTVEFLILLVSTGFDFMHWFYSKIHIEINTFRHTSGIQYFVDGIAIMLPFFVQSLEMTDEVVDFLRATFNMFDSDNVSWIQFIFTCFCNLILVCLSYSKLSIANIIQCYINH
jgi:hypothetical protein